MASHRKIPRILRLVGWSILALWCAFYSLLGGEYPVHTLFKMHQEQKVREAYRSELQAEVDSLRRERHVLLHDSLTLERIARERFGMIGEGETLYRYVGVTWEHRDQASDSRKVESIK